MSEEKTLTKISRVRDDLSPRVPTFMRNTQCKYYPLEVLEKIPDGLAICCRWDNRFDRAYLLNGKWFLVWNDRPMPKPDGVQVRRGIYEDVQ